MIKFGTGGWRAIIGDEFTKRNIQLLTGGLCALMTRDGLAGSQICIGYDRRFLSKEALQWACEVLAGAGFRAYVIRQSAPTPLIMFTVKQLGAPYGMAVTASHNPAIYNGIKLFTAGGRDAEPWVTEQVEAQARALEGSDIPTMDYEEAKARGLVTEHYPANDYIDSILDAVDVDAIKRAQLRIALDPMYGVAQNCLSTILMTCRCDLEIIHGHHDTLFGGKLPAPDENTVGALAAVVTDRHRCDLGIATDGDADRLGVVDSEGHYVHPNRLLVLLYYYLLKYRGWSGPCVRNNSTTHLLDRVAAGFGQKCYEVPVGFKHVSAKMAQTGAIIGGESSGGLTVRGHIAGKDGIYASALLVELLAVTGKTLPEFYREICDRFGELHYAEQSVTLTPARKEVLREQVFVRKAVPNFGLPVEKISYEDGCKFYFADGSWAICRFSGTEPVLRLAAEGSSKQQAEGYICRWKELLEIP